MTANRTALRRRLALSTALCAAAFAAAPAAAAPINTPAGTANTTSPITITTPDPKTTNVTSATNNIINWNSFDIASDEVVNFHSSTPANISILNRVIGANYSDISGQLNSDKNVAVYIINPNGIIFGSSARVNVGSLIASTLDITDPDFNDADGQLSFSGIGTANINVSAGAEINTGLNGSLGDALFLSGGAISAGGSIVAQGEVALLVAKNVTVVSNSGSPLRYTLQNGTSQKDAINIVGNVTGKAVTAALVSAKFPVFDVNNLLIGANAVITATGAAAGDGGITLVAGGGASGKVVSIDDPVDNAIAHITSNGNLTSNADLNAWATASVSLYGRGAPRQSKINVKGDVNAYAVGGVYAGGVQVDGSFNAYATLISAGDIFSKKSINFDARGGTQRDIRVDGTLEAAENITLQGGEIRIVSGFTNGMMAGGEINLLSTGTNVGDGIKIEPTSFGVKAQKLTLSSQESINLSSGANFDVLNGVTINSGKDITTGGLTATGRVEMSAGQTLNATGTVQAASLLLDSQTVTVQNLTTTSGNLEVRAYNGNAAIESITAAGSAAINTDGTGNVTVTGDVKTGGDFGIGAKGAVNIGGVAIIGNNFGVTAAGSFTSGAITAGGAASVSSAGNVTLNGDTTAGTIFLDGQNVTAKSLTSTTGKTEVRAWNGNAAMQSITATGGATISADGQGNPSLGNLTITGDVKAGGDLGINAIGFTRVEGSVDVTGGSAILKSYVLSISGNLTTSGSASLTGGFNSIGGNIVAGGDIIALGNTFSAKSVQSLNGGISLTTKESIAAESLTAATDIKAVVANGPGSIAGVRIGNATAGGDVLLASSEDIRINGNIIAGGDVDINASLGLYLEDGTSITANRNSGSIRITSRYGAELGGLAAKNINLSQNAGGITHLNGSISADNIDFQGGSYEQNKETSVATIGKLTGNNLTFLALNGQNKVSEIGNVSVDGAFAVTNSLGDMLVSGTVIAAAGQAYLYTAGALTLGAGSSLSGDNVNLISSRFINNAGSSAVTAANRWTITTDAPDGNVYGGLNSNNTAMWGWQGDDNILPGNRYVFRYQPTLTFTSLDYAKTYGDDIAALLAGRYTVSGLHAGVAGAFLGDTLTDVISGSPLLTSLGATARASVAGGPYVIEIGQGSLTSLSGYKFAFNDAGRVTVGKKALTATVAVNDKTYDGTTQATGSFSSLNGLVQGDVVEVGGKLTFASKNAGTQKVSVENLGLAGADAGNYTVTISVPDQLSATIFKKAVSVQVAVDDKTYDGTTKANGRITGIDGKIAGDDLNATGGSYTYGDKNAGADKLVTVSNIVIGGADAGNYEVTIPASVLADILKKTVTVNISADSKTYDQTTAATGRINGIDGVIAGDDVKATGGSYAFADKNAGKGKTVSVSGIQLSGGDLGNYDVTIPATVLAEILKRAVTITISVDGKTYDGTTDATGRITGMEGVLSGDQLTVTGGKFAFLDKNAGAGKAATANGFTYGGADAGNYEAVIAPGAKADIAKRAITVRANDATGYVFSPSTNLTYTVTQGSLAPGDAFTGALAREPGYVPGDYAIGLGTLSLSSNYDMTFEAGTFTLALGTPPLRQQVPDLYRSFELGGRAQAMRSEPRALIWAQAFDCQSSTRNAELCQ